MVGVVSKYYLKIDYEAGLIRPIRLRAPVQSQESKAASWSWS